MSNASIQPILVLLSGSAEVNPSQYIIEKALARHKLDWRYLTVEVLPERLADALAGIKAMGFYGGHFSDGHKEAALALLDQASETAAAVGVVNCFTRAGDGLRGDNLEGQGVLGVLRRAIDPAGKRIALLGAGRMARAVGYELAAAGAAEIRIVNRTEARAHELAEKLVGRFSSTLVSAAAWTGDYHVPGEIDVLVHATSLGQQQPGAPLPLAAESLRAGLVVVDVTVEPQPTWLLHAAATRGATAFDGIEILVEQRAIALRNWTGLDPDRTPMREAAEEFLEV